MGCNPWARAQGLGSAAQAVADEPGFLPSGARAQLPDAAHAPPIHPPAGCRSRASLLQAPEEKECRTHGLRPIGPRRARARRLPRWWSVFAASVPSGCAAAPPLVRRRSWHEHACRAIFRLRVRSCVHGAARPFERGPSPGGRACRESARAERSIGRAWWPASAPPPPTEARGGILDRGAASGTRSGLAGRRLCRLSFERCLGRGL